MLEGEGEGEGEGEDEGGLEECAYAHAWVVATHAPNNTHAFMHTCNSPCGGSWLL